MTSSSVHLGFLEDCEPWHVESRLFPSKFGGKPAWLALENLPTIGDLQCSSCNLPMIFLLQVYAPIEDDAFNFHRMIFVFICKNPDCHKRNDATNIKAFRCSLQRHNKYYPDHPPDTEKPDPNFSISNWLKLCYVCGIPAAKCCSKCKEASYCCRSHQVTDWKESHKKRCCSEKKTKSKPSKCLFPEKEIELEEEVIERNVEENSDDIENTDCSGNGTGGGTLSNVPAEDLEAFIGLKEDKAFTKFQEKVSHYPTQVLRYQNGGNPLWIATSPKPDRIPKCHYCGGSRKFEFQIMPQTLALIKEDKLDWGTIIIYTCSNNCGLNGASYKKEFVFKQDVSLDSE